MDFDKLTALLDGYDTGEVTKSNMLAQIKLHADERAAAERERAHNAGFVEASRMHGTEIERLRSVLVECQAHLACNAVTENLVALYGRVRAALGPNVGAKAQPR